MELLTLEIACHTQTMELECDYSKPDDVVRAFIIEMAHWQYEATQAMQAAAQTSQPNSFWTAIETSMQEIFDRYCTPKDRPYGRQGGTFSQRDNSDVTVNIIEVVHETSKRCAVTVEQAFQHSYKNKQYTMSKKFRYILLKKSGKWLIDNRKLHSATGEWIKYYL